MTTVSLSVIVPCHNASGTLGVLLDALARQCWSKPWEVVVADNGSTDDSRAVVQKYQQFLPELRLLDAAGRRGAAHARNVGARAARGEMLAFCDADDVVAPGWLAAISEAIADHGFVASRLDFEKLNQSSVQKSRINTQHRGLQHTRPGFLPHASASGLGIKRTIHEAVGGFDEALAFLEDTDYCWRVQLAGTALHYASEAVVHYRFRNTLRGIYSQAFHYGEYDVLLYTRYRPLGMGRPSQTASIRAWITLLRRLPGIRTEEARLRWVRQLAWRLGRLKGCLKHRVLAV